MAARGVPRSSTVHTPDALARAVVAAIATSAPLKWLDPCVGDGAFVRAVASMGVPRRHIHAFDLSRRQACADTLATTTRGVDFIRWASSRHGVCDRLVMNPPYVTLGQLRGAPRDAAMALRMPNGRSLFLNANYWCAFVLSAIQVVRPRGCMVAVLPAAWEYARYAQPIREAVGDAFGEVIEIRSTRPLFPDVLEGSIVLVARERGSERSIWRRAEVRDVEAMVHALEALARGETLQATTVIRSVARKRRETIRLGELMDIRIGAVTGDARYFLLTEAQRRELDLPRAAVRPVVTRARHLCAASLDASTWRQLLERGERVWLFCPGPRTLKHTAVRRYLKAGESGACRVDGYKLRRRDPWHHVPLPRSVDGFLSGMSHRYPFLVLRELSGLTATNTLYVVRLKRPFRSAVGRVAVALALLTSEARGAMARCARNYADGLIKLEPAELASVQVPVPRMATGGRRRLRLATAHLVAGRDADARIIADEWCRAEQPEHVGTHQRRRKAVG
jgi:adenine-specific DNA-methyltransferase